MRKRIRITREAFSELLELLRPDLEKKTAATLPADVACTKLTNL